MSQDSHHFVRVSELLGDELSGLHLSPICGEANLDYRIVNPRVQKPGLAFAGYYDYIKPGRVQIIGASETAYLQTLSPADREERLARITQLDVPVFILTKGLEPIPEFERMCRQLELPVLSSPSLSSVVIKEISYFLEEHLVPCTSIHGVLLEIHGLGVLLLGKSGVGKSECALDLIARGHSLVGDDRITIKKYPSGELVGYCEEALRYHMELRGIGIINAKDLFGLAAVRQRRSIDLVIELERWEKGKAYDRLGLDESLYDILDTSCPYILMPVATGRNMAILVEIAARNHVLKLEGHHSARDLARKLEQDREAARARQGSSDGPSQPPGSAAPRGSDS